MQGRCRGEMQGRSGGDAKYVKIHCILMYSKDRIQSQKREKTVLLPAGPWAGPGPRPSPMRGPSALRAFGGQQERRAVRLLHVVTELLRVVRTRTGVLKHLDSHKQKTTSTHTNRTNDQDRCAFKVLRIRFTLWRPTHREETKIWLSMDAFAAA